MIDKLSSLKLKNSVDTAVPSLALRAVITALPRPIPGIPSSVGVQEAYNAVSRVLIPRLIGPGPLTRVPSAPRINLPPVPAGLLQDDNGVNAEAVDVLVEVVRCFGPLLQQVEVEAMQEVVLQLLQGDKASSVVKKRAVVAISMLAVYLTDAHLEDVINRIQPVCPNPTFRLSRVVSTSLYWAAWLGQSLPGLAYTFPRPCPLSSMLCLRKS